MKRITNKLKLILSLGFSIFLFGCSTAPVGMVSDSPSEGMTKIAYEVEIASPKEHVWMILKDFDNLSWSKTVKDAHYLSQKRNEIGMARHCNLSDGGFIVEEITRWDEGNGFTYALTKASDPIDKSSFAHWTVRDGKNGKSYVKFEVHYALEYGIIGDAMNGLFAKAKFANSIKGFMHELKDYAETKSM